MTEEKKDPLLELARETLLGIQEDHKQKVAEKDPPGTCGFSNHRTPDKK